MSQVIVLDVTLNYTMFENLDELDPRQYILIKGAKVNNLKNVNAVIPRNRLIVITGLSGSGKSSLAFDTLFAEGQRMYVESLSSYARQFLGRMEKPEVDYIRGISPAIAVEQKGNTRNPRATVGTTTEIYDYLKLFYARVGRTYSPISGQLVKKNTVSDVVDFIQSYPDGKRFTISTPLQVSEERSLGDELKVIFQKGFSRVLAEGEILFIEEYIEREEKVAELEKQKLSILIDRNVVNKEEDNNQFRIADSVQTAFYEGQGYCQVEIAGESPQIFSNKFELDGIQFEEPSVQFFSFNSPYGACKTCGGFGSILAIDPDLVIPDKSLSVYEDAIAPWRTEKMQAWKDAFLKSTAQFDFPVHRPYNELNSEQQDLLWNGNEYFEGIHDFFKYVESQNHKIQYRVLMARYRGKIICPSCRGTRLREDASYVKIHGRSISDLVLLPISDLLLFFDKMELTPQELEISRRLLAEIQNRLKYLEKVGLGYLTLNRLTASLSGGEFQRIKLATALGSALVGSMYILDEPSVGLHPRDTDRLVEVLKDLKNLGNTVIVVEHEEAVMQAADQIIDMGPEAGSRGGDMVFSLSHQELSKAQGKVRLENPFSGINTQFTLEDSFTYNYLFGKDDIPLPKQRRTWSKYIEVHGARQNNLKNIQVQFPLDVLCVVSGVSGSGKSTLVKEVLFKALSKNLGKPNDTMGLFDRISGNVGHIQQIEMVDQKSIGTSSRSNPATYTKVYDAIRKLFAATTLAKQRSYTPAHFSFNVDKGRCETCEGEGRIKVEMQFMADIFLKCETCDGRRFKKEILEVTYKDKDISQVLDLTIEDAVEFFKESKSVVQALQPLVQVGLGYIQLGQSTNTLSGGESQRLKLASYLKEKKDRTFFIFDEPTTGLHFHDIRRLLDAIQALIDQGNSVLIIEHNLEVIKSADWLIDLGPEGGEGGGHICFEGLPEDILKLENNFTAQFLKEKLPGRS